MPPGGKDPAAVVEPIPENLFREPLDFVYADHFRQRVLCNVLEWLVSSDGDDGDATVQVAGALAYLKRDLPWHIEDEEQDLFPRLAARCSVEDRCNEILGILSADHAEDERLAAHLIAALEALAAGGSSRANPDLARTAGLFIGTQRRHLTWENGIVLPLARRRLQAADLAAMGRAMAQRRGIVFPE